MLGRLHPPKPPGLLALRLLHPSSAAPPQGPKMFSNESPYPTSNPVSLVIVSESGLQNVDDAVVKIPIHSEL